MDCVTYEDMICIDNLFDIENDYFLAYIKNASNNFQKDKHRCKCK